MKKITFILLLLAPILSFAKDNPAFNKLLTQWAEERAVISENLDWYPKDRAESRLNIQRRIVENEKLGEVTNGDMLVLMQNSKIITKVVLYIQNNKVKIISQSECEKEDNCSEVLYAEYVKKSDQIYTSKNK